MDILTPDQRHNCMSNIRSKDTKIEICLRSALWRAGIRYRKHYKSLPGTPDVALTKYKIAIFCDGEFFHGRDFDIKLKEKLQKSNNSEFWIYKIQKNIQRDMKVNRELRTMGWIVIRFWGTEIIKNPDACVRTVQEAITDRKTETIYFGE